MGKVGRMSLFKNIKVHFAGAEQISFARCLGFSDVNYYLFTVFPFISNQFGIKGYPITVKRGFVPDELSKISKHTIMDSGLFTLMFGAHAGNRDKDFLWRWQVALCDFVNKNNIKADCVEVDCQKILGVDEAWEFREKLRDMLPNNRQINVFHIPDGRKGLDRLIEFSEYIAISVPELRIAKRKTYKEDVYKLACYVKNKKPSIDIHLLGCTEKGLLQKCNFCTSADSTSWLQINRFGSFAGHHNSSVNPLKIAELYPSIKKMLIEYGLEPTEKKIQYHARYAIAGKLLKSEYVKYAGSQE